MECSTVIPVSDFVALHSASGLIHIGDGSRVWVND